jgi:threonine dehydrogenase-like Zn-dependent dehydrogenase
LLRVLRVGICGTDLHAFEGTQPFFDYPRILGHELAVEILELGPSDTAHGFAVGDICAVEPYLNCGTCVACRRGRTNCCVNLLTLGVHTDGGMREIIALPIRKLHAAGDVAPEKLALVEMLCIGAHAVRRANVEAGENVLVIGAGPIGLGTLSFAKKMQVKVIALDINADRLSFCREGLGIEEAYDAREMTPDALAAALGDLPTTVFDATGSLRSMENAFNYVAPSGQLVYVGLVKNDITFNDPFFHRREITLKSARNATSEDFDWVIESLADDSVNVDGWVTHMVPPEGLVSDFAGWLKPETGVIKAMLSF